MFLVKPAVQSAAAQIRVAEAQLSAIVRELQDAGVWSGADADRFQRDWQELVRGRLLGAASKLDGVSYLPMV